MNKKNMILGSIATIMGTATIVGPIVSLPQQKIDNNLIQANLQNELDKISTLKTTNLASSTLPSNVDNANIDTFLVKPNSINGVNFTLKVQNPSISNDDNGTIDVILEAQLNNLVLSKVITVLGFKSLSDQINLQNELDKITTLELTNLASSTLPSNVDNANIDTFLVKPNSINGVNFTLKVQNPSISNDDNGTIDVILEAQLNNLVLSKVITVSGFKSLNEQNLKNELDKITTLELTNLASSTLPSNVDNANIDTFLVKPNSINGVNFTLKVQNPSISNDDNGTIDVILEAQLNNLVLSKVITVSGFLKMINFEFNRINTLELNQNAKGSLPSFPNEQNLSSFINVPITNSNVTFSVSFPQNMEAANNLDGTLDVILTASQIGQQSISKSIKTVGWFTSLNLIRAIRNPAILSDLDRDHYLEQLKNWLFTGEIGKRNFQNLYRQHHLRKLEVFNHNITTITESVNSIIETDVRITKLSIERPTSNSNVYSLLVHYETNEPGWIETNEISGEQIRRTSGNFFFTNLGNSTIISSENNGALQVIPTIIKDGLAIRMEQLGLNPDPYTIYRYSFLPTISPELKASISSTDWIIYLNGNNISFTTTLHSGVSKPEGFDDLRFDVAMTLYG
ncbi:lipoprotein 17-related variable surface protein [[Mycoplasma] mobile]|nr:lipoprotein 17-related variable surface protein [[Mycoplasma] mobile]